MAGSTLITMPVMIFFVVVQRRLSRRPGGRGGEGMTTRAALAWRSRCCSRASPAPPSPAWLDRAAPTEGLAGVCLFGQNVEECRAGAGADRALHAPPEALVVASDEEGGSVTRLDARAGSPWPGAATLGALDDEQATYDVAAGLGPARAAAWGRPGARAGARRQLRAGQPGDRRSAPSGEHPELVDPARRRRSCAASRTPGCAACAKHFPGHGATCTRLPRRPARPRRRRSRPGASVTCRRSRPRSRPACRR